MTTTEQVPETNRLITTPKRSPGARRQREPANSGPGPVQKPPPAYTPHAPVIHTLSPFKRTFAFPTFIVAAGTATVNGLRGTGSFRLAL